MTIRGVTGWKVDATGTLVFDGGASNGLPVVTDIVIGTTTRQFKWMVK